MARELFEIGLSLFLGAIWFTACVPKIRHPRSFAVTVLSYDLLPVPAALALSRVLPLVELTFTVTLVFGFALPAAAVVSATALAMFLTAMVANLARGRQIDCGCGVLGGSRRVGAFTLARTAVLLGCSVALAFVAPREWTAFWFPVAAIGGPFAALWGAGLCLAASAVLWTALTRSSIQRPLAAGGSHSVASDWKGTGGNG